jgi:hypothetical protein
LLINRRIEGFNEIQNTQHLCKSCIIVQNLAGNMQVNKSNKNYYQSDDTVIAEIDRRSTVKSNDWRSSASKTLLLRWLAQVLNLHRVKGYIIVQTNCHAWTRE